MNSENGKACHPYRLLLTNKIDLPKAEKKYCFINS